ncbi:putative RNA-directed DNA polymerase, eukaryota, reverse transcriptase zinc-binding domain protein [Tanacetum coccineum]
MIEMQPFLHLSPVLAESYNLLKERQDYELEKCRDLMKSISETQLKVLKKISFMAKLRRKVRVIDVNIFYKQTFSTSRHATGYLTPLEKQSIIFLPRVHDSFSKTVALKVSTASPFKFFHRILDLPVSALLCRYLSNSTSKVTNLCCNEHASLRKAMQSLHALRTWIHACLHSSRASILINGSRTSEFSIKRVLRQGDPLSPFLFILVMEGLIRGIKIASGLKINIHKSNIFGIGVPNVDVVDMARRTGCALGIFPFTYLGLPIGCPWKSWYLLLIDFKAPETVLKYLE